MAAKVCYIICELILIAAHVGRSFSYGGTIGIYEDEPGRRQADVFSAAVDMGGVIMTHPVLANFLHENNGLEYVLRYHALLILSVAIISRCCFNASTTIRASFIAKLIASAP
jgi:hypothetical protein